MEFVEASTGSLFAFNAVVLSVIVAIVWMVSRAYQSRLAGVWAVAGFAGWLGALALLIESGRLERLPLSGFPLFFGHIVLTRKLLRLSGRAPAARRP